ncbi:hypothetical protein ETB97_007540 [Aspergillus alliaceus]|uniref:Uncharacterized protein n=1 Tax=Petromyces alliaceus TaxID=209559 RepID=A0A8H6E1X4_PETAA|nr:hypothetical protein ETB97_007540 [Aspergillus burnettii]
MNARGLIGAPRHTGDFRACYSKNPFARRNTVNMIKARSVTGSPQRESVPLFQDPIQDQPLPVVMFSRASMHWSFLAQEDRASRVLSEPSRSRLEGEKKYEEVALSFN